MDTASAQSLTADSSADSDALQKYLNILDNEYNMSNRLAARANSSQSSLGSNRLQTIEHDAQVARDNDLAKFEQSLADQLARVVSAQEARERKAKKVYETVVSEGAANIKKYKDDQASLLKLYKDSHASADEFNQNKIQFRYGQVDHLEDRVSELKLQNGKYRQIISTNNLSDMI